MIKLLNLNQFVKNLDPVSTTDYFTRTGDFHEAGLLSEKIFGPEGTIDRRKSMSYIDLGVKVIHPSTYRIIKQLDRKTEKFISAESSFILTKEGELIEDENGVTGLTEFMKMFPKIVWRTETETRKKFVELLEKSYKDNNIFIQYVPIIPPDYRPVYEDEKGQIVVDKLNDVYQSILRKSMQIKTASKGLFYDLIHYNIQRAVIDHDDFVRSKLQKKQGIIRNQMLGKRLDFSGRAVITPDPELKLNEIGIPMRLASSIFEPFIIFQLIRSGKTNQEELSIEIEKFTGIELSIDTIQKVLKSIKNNDKVPNKLFKIFFDATERAIYGRIVLAKRDPALHAESYRAYNPVLTTGDTIQLCTLQVGGHNADFDGDTMGIFHPMSDEAQAEAREKMMRLTSGTSSTEIAFGLSKEMWVGLFTITKDKSKNNSPVELINEDISKVTDPYLKVRYRNNITTAGKAIFNSCLPADFPFITKQITKSIVNKEIMPKLFEKYDKKIIGEIVSRMERVAFKWATIAAPSISIDDLELPKHILVLKKKFEESKDIESANAVVEEAVKALSIHLNDTGLGDLVNSGSTKGWDQPRQILFAKGIIADPDGNILDPINSSFSDGLKNKEFFNASSGARKGIIDRVINTADTGYMSRKLAFLLNTVEVDRTKDDCNTKRTLDLKLDKMLMNRLTGRYHLVNGKVELFRPEEMKIGQTIRLRSPVFCESTKLCHTCYGKLIERHKTPYVGVLAAQVIGSVGTQLIMRTFHTGGAVTIIKKDMIDDIVNNDPFSSKEFISKFLKQTENNLNTKGDVVITIDLEIYTMNDDIKIEQEKIWAKSLVCKAQYENDSFSIVLDYPVELEINDMQKTKDQIVLRYKKGDSILHASLEAAELKGQILYVERLLGGREIFKDAPHLYRKLLRVYGPQSGMDSIHLEILESQALRDKTKPNLPARLGSSWNPTMVNIKSTVFSEGFVQALAFENINKAVNEGLIGEEKHEPSILENVLTGTLVEVKKK